MARSIDRNAKIAYCMCRFLRGERGEEKSGIIIDWEVGKLI